MGSASTFCVFAAAAACRACNKLNDPSKSRDDVMTCVFLPKVYTPLPVMGALVQNYMTRASHRSSFFYTFLDLLGKEEIFDTNRQTGTQI
jgi:hypothetical protein